MDWTGGARRRFAPKKNNAIIQRQKAYFAKARAALNNTNPSTTPLQPFTNQSNPGSRGRMLSHQSLLESRTGHELRARSRTSTQGLGGEEKRYGWETRPSSRRREPKPFRSHSPSAISVNSINSRRASSAHSRQAKEQQMPYHHITAAAANMNEEERLLHANRRRLLAQDDWLGLAPTQPLRMKFSTSHDKVRIGKRRKVDSVRSKKGEPAGQRLFTPLFDERLPKQEHFMSGALQRDDFHFKIGTDALATQTQPSNRSYTPGKTSLIQPSTEFERLSEESMLLGPDDDTFDPFQAPHESTPPGQPSSPQTQHLCGVPNMRGPRDERINDEDLDTQSADIYIQDDARPHEVCVQKHEQKPYEWLSDDGSPPNMHGPTHQGGAHVMAATHRQGADESAPSQLHERVGDDRSSAPPSTANSSAADDDDGNDDDDDELWRNFMKAAKPGSSNPSIMAVKSSSFHITTSQSSHRPILIRHYESRDTPLVSTPNGAGTQGPRTHGHVQTVSEDTSPEPTEDSRSPAASLKPTEGFAMQPPALVGAAQDNEDHDALWRQFVCGTQDDSDTSSQLGLASRNQDRDGGYSPALVPASPSYTVSGLGTSNHTTIGDGTMLMPGSMSTASRRRTTPPNHDTRSPEEGEFTKALEAAARDGNDDDSIEDDEPSAVQRHQAKNIHATERSILNPRRFKPPRKRRRSPARPMLTQFIARQPQLQTAKQGRSVYDLVDSDGNSVA